jgi:hypothetical protein
VILALKLLTLPLWVGPWIIAKVFRARAVVRTGRRRYPVRIRIHR